MRPGQKTRKTLEQARLQEKRCGRCGLTKPFSAFPSGKKGTHGLLGWCRDCKNADWREKHPREIQSLDHLTIAELGYIAGIFDGEGTLHLGYTKTYGLQIRISNTCYPLIEWLNGKLCGSITPDSRHSAHHKPSWRWSVGTDEGIRLLRLLRPYLIVKVKQFEVAERFCDLRETFRRERREAVGRAKDKPPRGEPRFESLCVEMRTVNMRGRHL